MARRSHHQIRRELETVIANLRRIGFDIAIMSAYDMPRLEKPDSGDDPISPRLPTPHLLDWAYAFQKGVFAERARVKRIAEIESTINADLISADLGAREQHDDDGKLIERIVTCGECGMSWNDALITCRTPAPSARCPYEHVHDLIAELKLIKGID